MQKQINIDSMIEHERKQAPEDHTFQHACTLASRTKFATTIEAAPHTYSCGTEGTKAKKLTIEIEFDQEFYPLQMCSSFQEGFVEELVGHLVHTYNGHLDNDIDEHMSEQMQFEGGGL